MPERRAQARVHHGEDADHSLADGTPDSLLVEHRRDGHTGTPSSRLDCVAVSSRVPRDDHTRRRPRPQRLVDRFGTDRDSPAAPPARDHPQDPVLETATQIHGDVVHGAFHRRAEGPRGGTALERGAAARALGAPVEGAVDDVAVDLRRRLEDRILGMIAGGRGGRRIAVGTEAVHEALGAGPTARVIVARDARGDRDAIEAAARRAGVPVTAMLDKERIGRAVGKGVVGVLAVVDAGLGAALGHEAALLESLDAEHPIEATR